MSDLKIYFPKKKKIEMWIIHENIFPEIDTKKINLIIKLFEHLCTIKQELLGQFSSTVEQKLYL